MDAFVIVLYKLKHYNFHRPCISDMTLQVVGSRMPVFRYPNYTDKTWDIQIDKIPIMVGNHTKINGKNVKQSSSKSTTKTKTKTTTTTTNSNSNSNSNVNCYCNLNSTSNTIASTNGDQTANSTNINSPQLKTVSLKEYLSDVSKYMTHNPLKNNKNGKTINLLKSNNKETHVIMSAQACMLPIEKNKQTHFNVALYSYQTTQTNPTLLAIVATSKGTSMQVVTKRDQCLLFNNNGIKANFIAQR